MLKLSRGPQFYLGRDSLYKKPGVLSATTRATSYLSAGSPLLFHSPFHRCDLSTNLPFLFSPLYNTDLDVTLGFSDV